MPGEPTLVWLGDNKLEDKLDGTYIVQNSHGLIYTTAAVLPGVGTRLYVVLCQ